MSAQNADLSDRVLSAFGITFEVFRSAPPNENVVQERLIPFALLNVDTGNQEVVLELDAFGEQKEKGVQGVRGNTVKLFIPREALLLLTMEFEKADQQEKLLAKAGR
jgi:hypothetical protein